MPIRFHLDENVARSVAGGLRQRGIDVTMPSDVGLMSAPDEQHLAFALREGRVLFTHDDDFVVLHRRRMAHVGIVYSPPRTRPIGRLVRDLLLIAEVMTPEEMRNHIEFI